MTRRSGNLAAQATFGVVAVVGLVAFCSGCQREAREPRVQPPMAELADGVAVTDLEAGQSAPPSDAERDSDSSGTERSWGDDYEQNAYAISEGKKLYSHFNCVGCHANGGGGMGPAFIDEEWIYGKRPEQIYASIVQGRPNGMPTYQGHVTRHQVWQLVAYVRSLGGLVDEDVAPGRSDALKGRDPEHTLPRQSP